MLVAIDVSLDVAPCFFPALGEIDARRDSPIVAGSLGAVLRGNRFHGVPLLRLRLIVALVFSSGRKKEHAVLTGELEAHRISRRRDGERHARLLIGTQL